MIRHKLVILLTVAVLSAVSCDRSFVFMQLTDTQIRMLIRNYDPKVKYKRINGKRFVRET